MKLLADRTRVKTSFKLQPWPDNACKSFPVWQVTKNLASMPGEGVWVRAALWSILSVAFLSRSNPHFNSSSLKPTFPPAPNCPPC